MVSLIRRGTPDICLFYNLMGNMDNIHCHYLKKSEYDKEMVKRQKSMPLIMNR